MIAMAGIAEGAMFFSLIIMWGLLFLIAFMAYIGATEKNRPTHILSLVLAILLFCIIIPYDLPLEKQRPPEIDDPDVDYWDGLFRFYTIVAYLVIAGVFYSFYKYFKLRKSPKIELHSADQDELGMD